MFKMRTNFSDCKLLSNFVSVKRDCNSPKYWPYFWGYESFFKEYSSFEDITNSIYYGPCLWVENTFSLGDCIIQISKNQFVKFEKFCMLEASIIAFCIYYLINKQSLSGPRY